MIETEKLQSLSLLEIHGHSGIKRATITRQERGSMQTMRLPNW